MGAVIEKDMLSWSKPVEVQTGASIVGSGPLLAFSGECTAVVG